MRLFVAIDPPEPVLNEIEPLLKSLPGGKSIPRDQVHLTLRFIGEIPQSELEKIKSALSAVREAPFALALKGTGCFPQPTRPRVLWVGVTPSPALTDLHRKIEESLVPLGLPRERRSFHPHMTLARFKKANVSRIQDFLTQYLAFQTDSFDVMNFHLYSSTLTPAGAVHKKEQTITLTAP